MAKQNRQFLFTNENLYDQNIFGRIYPQFMEALQKNNLIALHKTVETYFYLTQHFYQSSSDDIERSLAQIHDQLNSIAIVKTKSQALRKQTIEIDVAVELRQLWKQISNHLHKNDYFKKSYAVDTQQLALPKK